MTIQNKTGGVRIARQTPMIFPIVETKIHQNEDGVKTVRSTRMTLHFAVDALPIQNGVIFVNQAPTLPKPAGRRRIM